MAKKEFEVALILTAADKASKIINDVTINAQKRIKSMSEMGDKAFSFGRGAGAVGLGMAAVLALPLKAAADMESMNIALKTSFQGNADAAAKAFSDINKFAAKTPYELEEVMTGFIKLKNMGLDPSEEALTAYGNTASAMGKSLNDMVEAVADAATGEFERLKEFGIKASSQGDKVTFMFQGVKTTLGKNSKEIEQYLKYVGNVKFAGGIDAQSKSIKGQLSTLKDSVMMTASKLGTTLIPRLNELFKKVGPVIDKISNWVEKNPKLVTTIMEGAVKVMLLSFGVSALSFAFGGLFKAISFVMAIGNSFKTLMLIMRAGQMAYTFSVLAGSSATATFTAVVTAMNMAFLASPIFWIVAGIVALGAAVYLVYKNWGSIKDWFVKLWNGVKNAFLIAWTFIKNIFLNYTPHGLIIKHWDKISGFFVGLWNKVKNIFKSFIGFVLGWTKPFLNIGANIIDGIWNGIKSRATQLFNFVKGIGKGIALAFKNVLGIASPSKVFMDYGVNITQGAQKGIEKGVPSLVGASNKMGKSVTPNSVGGSRSSGGGITVNFSPVISGSGGGDVASEIKKLIPQLIREIESSMARKQKLAY